MVVAAGRVLATGLETLVVVGALYGATELVVGIDLGWDPAVLVPVGFLVVASVGYSLAVGALTMAWKRVEMLNDLLIVVVFFAAGVMVPLDDTPGWMVPIGRLLPITHPIAAARSVLLDGDGLALTGDGGLLPMGAVTAGWFAAGAYAFHRADRAVRRDGTLTRY
jgi:ABC-2 type transport system permease protein